MRVRFNGQRGISLIEALIALLVSGFGMLALVAMQITLARGADVARQRGEATRLAQQQVEQLRSFTMVAQLDAQTTQATAPSGPLFNTAFNRTTTITTSPDGGHRVVNVAVTWADRASEAQRVDLRTVIARQEPSLSGDVEFPPRDGQNLRRPKNRNMNIPVPATPISPSYSSLPFKGGSIVFGNDSGSVVKICTFVVQTLADIDRCTTVEAYLLAGYVTKTMASFPPTLDVNEDQIITGGQPADCVIADALDQNGAALTTPPKYDLTGTKYYLCVVQVPTKGATWSGTLRLAGMATGADYLVCRFEYPPSQGGTPNERHPARYDKVDSSLDNQDYVITTASNCPVVDGLQTVLQQDCRASNANRSAECPAT